MHAALEVEALALPSGPAGGQTDGYLAVRPVFGVDVGPDFQAELGPTFRLRLVDQPPEQRSEDLGHLLRGRDWDEASDFGQIISDLRLGAQSRPFFVRAGPVRKRTLGFGHLINRYSNQENPDYHPSAATAVLNVGPIRAELLVSDLFGARLFAGEIACDLGRAFSSSPDVFDRYGVAVQVAHDASMSGLPAQVTPLPLTLLQVDASAVVLRNQTVRLAVLTGAGARISASSSGGFLVGLALDTTLRLTAFSVKLEGRKQAGGFRQGLVGPSYELSRFAGLGLSGAPIAQERLPDAFSVYLEGRAKVGELISVDAMVEYFTWGRTDFDSSLNVLLLKRRLVANTRFTAVGLGAHPRYAITASARLRLISSLYVLGAGGTVFFPQEDGTLTRGVTASVGFGVDFEH